MKFLIPLALAFGISSTGLAYPGEIHCKLGTHGRTNRKHVKVDIVNWLSKVDVSILDETGVVEKISAPEVSNMLSNNLPLPSGVYFDIRNYQIIDGDRSLQVQIESAALENTEKKVAEISWRGNKIGQRGGIPEYEHVEGQLDCEWK